MSSRILPEVLSRNQDASPHFSQREFNSFLQIKQQILHNEQVGAQASEEGKQEVIQESHRVPCAVMTRSPRFNEEKEQRRSAQDQYFKGLPGSIHLAKEGPESGRTK